MSQVKISGNASGTGVLTIAAPNTNTDRTINIPDTAGDIVTTGDSGTITAPMLYGGQTGSAPAFAARVWLYYNGVTNTIVGSGNVSSVTDNGNGNYTVNFTTALANNDYSAVATGYRQTSFTNSGTQTSNFTTSSYIIFHIENGSNTDTSVIATVVVGG